MPSRQEDIKFLRQCLQARREYYERCLHSCYPEDFGEVTDESTAKWEAEMKRIVGLADTYGSEKDADFLRDYLLPDSDWDDNPTSPWAMRRLAKEIKIIDRLIITMEKIEEADEEAENLAPLEIDEQHQQVVVGGKRYDVTDDQIRILKLLSEKPGEWIMGKRLRPDITSDQRVDKIITRMPEEIREMIESHTRNGYRLKDTLR